MEITVCIGSSCHLKGSRDVVFSLEQLVKNMHLSDKVTLNGCFCTGQCVQGVCVTMEDHLYSVTPNTVETFFYDEVLRRIG